MGRGDHNAVVIINHEEEVNLEWLIGPYLSLICKVQIDNDTHLKCRINVNCFSSSRTTILSHPPEIQLMKSLDG